MYRIIHRIIHEIQILKVECGWHHTLLVGSSRNSFRTVESSGVEQMDLEEDTAHQQGEVVCSLGQGSYGQLGNKTNKNAWIPQKIDFPNDSGSVHVLGAGNGFSIASRRPVNGFAVCRNSKRLRL